MDLFGPKIASQKIIGFFVENCWRNDDVVDALAIEIHQNQLAAIFGDCRVKRP